MHWLQADVGLLRIFILVLTRTFIYFFILNGTLMLNCRSVFDSVTIFWDENFVLNFYITSVDTMVGVNEEESRYNLCASGRISSNINWFFLIGENDLRKYCSVFVTSSLSSLSF